MKARLQAVAVAFLGGALGLQLACGFAFDGVATYAALGVAWFSMAFALMLEPSPRAPLGKTLLAAGVAALTGGLVTLGVMRLVTPAWNRGDDTLGAALVHVWSLGDAVRVWTLLTLSALPAPLALLLVRRVGRQLEWQAVAAAIGPVVVSQALFPGELGGWGLLLMLLSGLPLGFGAYLLDRRLLGPAALATFPDEPPPPVDPDGNPTPPYLLSRPAGPALKVLLGALVLGLLWAAVLTRAGRAFAPSGIHPGMPDLAALFDEVRAAQERHRERTGAYARTLGALETLPLDVRGGATRGYVLRYARLGDACWILTADPVPARPGWPSFRLVAPGSGLERGVGPFPLALETS